MAEVQLLNSSPDLTPLAREKAASNSAHFGPRVNQRLSKTAATACASSSPSEFENTGSIRRQPAAPIRRIDKTLDQDALGLPVSLGVIHHRRCAAAGCHAAPTTLQADCKSALAGGARAESQKS